MELVLELFTPGDRLERHETKDLAGGEGGIRTLGTGFSPYNGLANRRIRPLCHLSGDDFHQFNTRNVTLKRYALQPGLVKRPLLPGFDRTLWPGTGLGRRP